MDSIAAASVRVQFADSLVLCRSSTVCFPESRDDGAFRFVRLPRVHLAIAVAEQRRLAIHAFLLALATLAVHSQYQCDLHAYLQCARVLQLLATALAPTSDCPHLSSIQFLHSAIQQKCAQSSASQRMLHTLHTHTYIYTHMEAAYEVVEEPHLRGGRCLRTDLVVALHDGVFASAFIALCVSNKYINASQLLVLHPL